MGADAVHRGVDRVAPIAKFIERDCRELAVSLSAAVCQVTLAYDAVERSWGHDAVDWVISTWDGGRVYVDYQR